MAVVTQSEFRANMAKYLDQVEADAKELIITRSGKKSAMVVIPLEQWESWEETEYLLSTAENRSALVRALEQSARGEGVEVDLDALERQIGSRSGAAE